MKSFGTCVFRSFALAALLVGMRAASVSAQELPGVSFAFGDDVSTLPIDLSRGFLAIPVEALTRLGWESVGDADGDRISLSHVGGTELSLTPESPLITLGGRLVHLADVPYSREGSVYVPLQLVVDVLPGLLPDEYSYDEPTRVLSAADVDMSVSSDEPVPGSAEAAAAELDPAGRRAEGMATPGPAPSRAPFGGAEGAPRVVIVDPGHGGSDPGAIGPSGLEEKEVALSIGLALARALSERDGVEVRITREGDEEVPLDSRGAWATEWTGDRTGVFVSIHVNALPDRPGVRGFETYFLSQARTEHERNVAAAENTGEASDPELTRDPLFAVLSGAFDHEQWSAPLADEVQRELGTFHPGTDRGVRQAPLAVISNALMPSVLVEVGFITNPEEERLMSRSEFHRDVAQAIERAVSRFLDRYSAGGAP